MRLPVDEAFLALDALWVLGPEDPVTAELLPIARATLTELKARPILEQLDALAARGPAAALRTSTNGRDVAARDRVAG